MEIVKSGVIEDISKVGVKYFKQLFTSAFRNRRDIKVVRSFKDNENTNVYILEMRILDDDHEPELIFPATLLISQVLDDDQHIDVELKLPDVNNLNIQKTATVREKFENSKKAVEALCWETLRSLKYDEEEFLDKFSVKQDTDMFNLDSSIDVKPEFLQFNAQMIDSSKDIKLSAIYASYSPVVALETLEDLLENEEFIELVPSDKPATFRVSLEDEDYNVGKAKGDAEDCTRSAFANLIKYLYEFYFDTKYYYHAAKGPRADLITARTETYAWWIEFIIDKLNSMIVDRGWDPVHPISFVNSLQTNIQNLEDMWSSYVCCMRLNLLQVCSAFDLYLSNFTDKEKSEVEDWIVKWKYELYSCNSLAEHC